MKPLKVSCDRCLFVFEMQSHMFTREVAPSDQEKLAKDGIELVLGMEKTGFICPNCGVETIAVWTTPEIRALQAKVQKERKRAEKKLRNGVPLSKAERKLRQAKRELKDAMDKVNGREKDK